MSEDNKFEILKESLMVESLVTVHGFTKSEAEIAVMLINDDSRDAFNLGGFRFIPRDLSDYKDGFGIIMDYYMVKL